MKIFVICHWDRGFDACINETARLTRDEAEQFIAEQDDPKAWDIDPIDCPLTLESPRIMAEAAAS